MRKIIAIFTWRCFLSCSYCDYRFEGNETGGILHCFGKQHKIGEELSWQSWVSHLERFSPFLIDMTGGEPTCYEDLPKLLANLPKGCQWAITSNTLNDVSKFTRDKCRFWTASYHYHSEKVFFKNLGILKGKGIPTRVTIVITPDNFKIAEQRVKELSQLKIGVNIHRILKQGFSWEDYPEIYKQIDKLEEYRGVVVIKDIMKEFKGKRFAKCTAGGNYFTIRPDGKVYRCYSGLIDGREVGHISNYIAKDTLKECGEPCYFPCDLEEDNKVKTGEIKGVRNEVIV